MFCRHIQGMWNSYIDGTWLYCPFYSEGQYNQVPFFDMICWFMMTEMRVRGRAFSRFRKRPYVPPFPYK